MSFSLLPSPRLVGCAALLLGLAACEIEIGSPVEPPPPDPTPVGVWRATTVGGNAIPGRLYLFDPDHSAGYPASVHFIVDSASLTLSDDGRYQHRIWASEWEGPVGGSPTTRRLFWTLSDHGSWSRTGGGLRLQSGYLQNHVMEGTFGAQTGVVLRHGLSHGDPPVPFIYGRR